MAAVELTDIVYTETETDTEIETEVGKSITTLTPSSGTITQVLTAVNNYKATITENSTVGTPSGMVAGMTGMIYIIQDSTGGWTLAEGSWDSIYQFMGSTYTLDTTADVTNVFQFEVFSATKIVVNFLGSF